MRMTPQQTAAELDRLLPCTLENVERLHAIIFAPWVGRQGLEFLEVELGRVKARLRQDAEQQFFSGAVCGQAMMSAIDTVMTMAMLTHPRVCRGTASQNNQFLRPAVGDDLIIEATVLKMGGNSAYGETRIFFERSGDLVAHSTSEFAL